MVTATMTSLTELQDYLQTLELPKNFRVMFDRLDRQLVQPPENAIQVTITAYWDDIYHPGSKAQTFSNVRIEPWMPEGLIRRLIYDSVRMLWLHELHEYMKIGGDYFHHPHPEGRNGPLG
jgi:hypothetical protein